MEDYGQRVRETAAATVEAASDGTLDAFEPSQLMEYAADRMAERVQTIDRYLGVKELDLFSMLVGAAVTVAVQTLAADDDY